MKKRAHIRPIKVCARCNSLFRLEHRETLEAFSARSTCGACTFAAFGRTPAAIAKPPVPPKKQSQLAKKASKKAAPERPAAIAKTAAKPAATKPEKQSSDVRRKPPALPVEPPQRRRSNIAGNHNGERLWGQAKWEEPSETIKMAAFRYAQKHGMTLEDVIKLFGYQSLRRYDD